MSFLTAEWRKLVLVNYVVDKNLLSEYIPFGTELDTYNGKCYISLVGFMFENTKVLGIKIPFHINFEEVNLRFYVRRIENENIKRGVVFIKEIVPKHAISIIANSIYHENYETMKMKHSWNISEKSTSVEYQWKKDENWNKVRVSASGQSSPIKTESEEEFITEHYWGYAKINDHSTNEYEVTHPKWNIYEVENYEIDVDFGATYGSNFEFLNDQDPVSVMLAEGSEITVERKKKIR